MPGEHRVRRPALRRDLRLVVVLGHSGCGAVAAAVDLYLDPDAYGAIAETHSLRTIIDRILFVVRIADKALERRCGPTASAEPGYRAALWEMAVYLNAALTAHDLARELGLIDGDGPSGWSTASTTSPAHRVGRDPDRRPAVVRPGPRTSERFLDLGDRLADDPGLDLRPPNRSGPVDL